MLYMKSSGKKTGDYFETAKRMVCGEKHVFGANGLVPALQSFDSPFLGTLPCNPGPPRTAQMTSTRAELMKTYERRLAARGVGHR
jgi:hypothetical protein